MAILGYDNSKLEIREYGIEGMLKRRGFDGWLEVAVGDLAAPGRERIARELETHYAEAVSAYLTSGKSEANAKAAALSDLGDPTEAAKRFYKRHLTEWEAKQIRFIEKGAAKPLFSFWTLLWIILPLAGITILFWRTISIGYPWLYAAIVVSFVAGFRLIPRLLFKRAMPTAARLRGYVLSYLLSYVGLAIAFGQIAYSIEHNIFYAMYNSCIVSWYWISFSLRILAKLRNNEEVARETPPKAAASS